MVRTSYPLTVSVPVVTVMFEHPSEGLFSTITICKRKAGRKTRGDPRGLILADSNETSEMNGAKLEPSLKIASK